MNKQELELAKLDLKGEREVLEEMRGHYRVALDRVNARIDALADRDDLPGIRQRRFQETLAEQIGGIIDDLGSGCYTTLEDYLSRCYEDGFVGTLYNLQKQGVPLAFPLDQEAMARAVTTTADGVKLSKRMYGNVSKLQKQVMAEITRGFADASHVVQTAQKMAVSTDIAGEIKRNVKGRCDQALRRSMTIARTEKGRVMSESRLLAMHKAKEAGADVVKQWDSTLDSRTRDDHRKLDGQIRELDEPFEVAGCKGMAPHKFGRPEQDINCRCVVLQRSRTALEMEAGAEYSKWDGVNQCYVDLSDAESYGEFKDRLSNTAFMAGLPFEKSITAEERNAVLGYTGGGNVWLNPAAQQAARGEGYDGKHKAELEVLHGALAKAVLENDTVVYRAMTRLPDGFDIDMDAIAEWAGLKKHTMGSFRAKDTDSFDALAEELLKLKGKTSEPFGFMSTSADSPKTARFGNYVLEINAAKGMRGADVSKLSDNAKESEVLFDYGYSLKVTDVRFQVARNPATKEYILQPVFKCDMVEPAPAKAKPAEKRFTPAKTVEEAQGFAKQFVSETAFSPTFKNAIEYKGLSVDAANEINKALDEAFRMGNLPKLSGIKAISPTSAQGKKVFSGSDAIAAYNFAEGGIFLNKSILKDEKAFAKHVVEAREAFDFIKANIAKLSGKKRDVAERYVKAGRSLVDGETIVGAITHEIGHHVDWAVFSAKGNDVRGRMSDYADGISGYAGSSVREYMAECFVAYMRGERNLLDPEYISLLEERTGAARVATGGSGAAFVRDEITARLREKPVRLPKKEYPAVMSAINTNFEARFKGKRYGTICVNVGRSAYEYHFIINEFGDYTIIERSKID